MARNTPRQARPSYALRLFSVTPDPFSRQFPIAQGKSIDLLGIDA